MLVRSAVAVTPTACCLYGFSPRRRRTAWRLRRRGYADPWEDAAADILAAMSRGASSRELLLRGDAPNTSAAPSGCVGYSEGMSPTVGRKPRKAATKTPSGSGVVRNSKPSGADFKHTDSNGVAPIVEIKGPSKDAPGWRSQERTQFLIETVGGVNKLAKTLGVSSSQPSRWKSGQETPSPEVAARLLDLDHVIALAVQTWAPAVVMDWMTSANDFLEGARPIDVIRLRGSSDVIDALKATLSGAYA